MTVLGLDFSIEMEWRGERLKEMHSLILHGCDTDKRMGLEESEDPRRPINNTVKLSRVHLT